jgi:hypothetical protein
MAGARYLSKPAAVDAVQWTGDNAEELVEFAGIKVEFTEFHFQDNTGLQLRLHAGVDGAQGWVNVPQHYWLVTKPNDPSDIWPVDPEHFADKYRQAA